MRVGLLFWITSAAVLLETPWKVPFALWENVSPNWKITASPSTDERPMSRGYQLPDAVYSQYLVLWTAGKEGFTIADFT